MSKPTPSPNRRAAKALIITLGIPVAFMIVMPVVGMLDCHRRGFELRWNGLTPTCLMDFSKGVPKPRW
jgi:hypothetical protein